MPRLTLEWLNGQIVSEDYHKFPGTTMTICCLTLKNGYNVIGQSACVDPTLFDAAMGRTIARSDAVNKMWPLEGYRLAQKMYFGKDTSEYPPTIQVSLTSKAVPFHQAPSYQVFDVNEMKRYEGTKRLRAIPMCKLDYVNYRAWLLPEKEDPDEQGYLVEYEDGGKPNDDRHQGYISWSPADVFLKSYHQIPG